MKTFRITLSRIVTSKEFYYEDVEAETEEEAQKIGDAKAEALEENLDNDNADNPFFNCDVQSESFDCGTIECSCVEIVN